MRATFNDFSGNVHLRMRGSKLFLLKLHADCLTCGMHAVSCRDPDTSLSSIRYIARHLIQAITICWIRTNWCSVFIAVLRFYQGNSPCQILAIVLPRHIFVAHTYAAPFSPPRAANSHSASVGNSLLAHAAYAIASSNPAVQRNISISLSGCDPIWNATGHACRSS